MGPSYSTYASFFRPYGLALDVSDNLYVCDYANDAIRMINSSNILVTTVAGGGLRGLSIINEADYF